MFQDMKFKKQTFLYLILLVLAVSIMVILRNFIKQTDEVYELRDYEEIMASGVIKVVTDYNSIGYFISGDSARGFQLDMINALEDDWNIGINLFLENSLDDNLNGLQTQKYDIIARNIPQNSDLKEQFAFTSPITFNKLVLVQRKAEFNKNTAPVRQHLDLSKKEIHVPAESPAILRLNNLSEEIGSTIYIVEDMVYEQEQLVIMVAAGEIDYTVCDEKVAIRLAEKIPEIDIKTDMSFTQLESWAVRKDSPVLLDSLNRWLSDFKNTKRFREIFVKYY